MSSEKPERIRISLTFTKAYVEALDYLVEEGIYLTRGEIILEALRDLLRRRGIGPFAKEGEGENKA